MAQTQEERLTNLMDSIAGRLRLGDKIKCQANGPQVVIAPDQQTGQPGLQVGWQLTLWLEHNVLIGQDPIGVTIPVAGVLPPPGAIEQAVPFLLEQARNFRHQANNPEPASPALPSADEVLAAMRGKQGQ